MALKPLDFDPFAKDEQPARLTELDFDPFASDEPQHKPYDRSAYEAELADFGKGMSRSAKKAEAERQVAAERWEKTPVAASAQAVGQEIYDAALFHLPSAAAAAIEGSDVYAERDWKDDLIERSRAQSKARADERKGKDLLPGIDGLGQSLAFSGVGMVGGAGTGIAAGAGASAVATPLAGTVAGWTSGTAASGALAYRMATNVFVRDLREAADQESVKRTGQPMSDEEFSRKSAELAPLIREYGLWEAVPEAAGNAVGFGILKAGAKDAIGSMFGKNVLTRLTTKMGSLYGTELATETVTQQGQHNVEVGALGEGEHRDWTRAADLGASFKEVAPQTILQTTLLAGGTRAGLALHDRIKRGGLTPDQFDALQELNANVEGARIDPEAARMEAIRLLDPSGTIMVPAPAGVREQAAASVEVTPEDESSPIPSELIREGRQAIADVDASKSADEILSRAGMPGVNARVMVDYGDGRVMAGTVVDAFSEENAELGAAGEGVKIKLDNGRVLSDFFDTLAEAGVRIAPEVAEVASGTQAADVSDTNVGDMTPAKPGQGQMVADERASVTDTTGLASAGAGMAGGITDSMYDMLWTKIEAGDVTEGGEPSTVLQVAKAIRDGGGTISREKLPALANMVSSIKGMGLPNAEYQQAMRNLVASLTPSREESAQTPTDGVIDAPKQAAAVSAPRVFINKVGSDGLTDTERGGPIEKPAISIEPFSDKSIIVRGVGENDGARFAGMTGKPLWNAKAKGWVFSKKREAEVRERLGAALTSSSASAAPNSPPMDGWARDVADAFKSGGQDAARAKFNEIVDREKLPTGMAAILSDKSKALMKVDGHSVNSAPNVEVIAVTDKPKAPRSPAPAKKLPKKIGVNAEGNPVFEDKRGVRSFTGGGVRQVEKVGVAPGGALSIDTANRDDRFKTVEEGVQEFVDDKRPEPPQMPSAKGEAKYVLPGFIGKPHASESAGYGAGNKVFTADAAAKARALLKAKMGQLNSGLDPEIVQAGITLAGYHIEAGARSFAAYTKAMVDDLGEAVRPYLRSWYEAVRHYPGFDATGMSTPEEIATSERDEKSEPDAAPTAQAKEGAKAATKDERMSLAEAVHDFLASPANSFATIAEARAFATERLGRPVEPGTQDAKMVDEAVELGAVLAAREIIASGEKQGRSPQVIYDRLVGLYERMPKLGVRTSTSVAQQAYSTPVPLAYLAGRLAGINGASTVYEPSAGNGALLITANPANILANELNADRAAALRASLLGATVTDHDAAAWNPQGRYDVVIENPPFGLVKDEGGQTKRFAVSDEYTTSEIDHAIAFKSLEAMKDGGTAVLIVGSVAKTATTDDARSNAYNAKAKREFYLTLYRAYNVVDHFTVAGELYEKQGAGWPVDVIVIRGRGASARRVPAADVPRQYASWEQLKEVLNVEYQGAAGGLREADGNADRGRSESGTSDGSDRGRGREGRADRGRDDAAAVESDGVRDGRPDGEPAGTRLAEPAARRDSAAAKDRQPARPARRDQVKAEGENARQVGYQPVSRAQPMGTLVPVNMQTSVKDALDALELRVGDIDTFVADRLGYAKGDLGKYFGAEQVDAIALAIDNMERGAGFIIGDQTGIGKGRVVASIIRYALKAGRTPIFVTEKPNLYADMFRDLGDIGVPAMLGRAPKILMTNAGEAVPLDEEGKTVLKSGPAQTHNKLLTDLARTGGLGDYDMVFTTYSQMQTQKGDVTPRMAFLERVAQGGVMIFDESHNAGGSAQQGMDGAKKKEDEQDITRATFARKLARLANGVFYSSATYAKRPEVMDLYATTDMRLAVSDISKLADAIKKGGVPMQQVVAAMLAKAGQYIRRERSFDGVTYEAPVVAVDRRVYSDYSRALRAIQMFSDGAVKGATKGIDRDMKADGKSISGDGSTGGAGAESTNFTSIMHNLIDQMLLAIKADVAADRAIATLKRGEKPVITVANTMGSFIADYVEDVGIAPGAPIDLSFANMLDRYLERSRMITIRRPFMKKGDKAERHYLTDAELGPAGVSAFKAVKELIAKSDFSGLPVSPIDHIRARLAEAGHKVGEITGRTAMIDYRKDGAYYRTRPSAEVGIAGRRKSISGFNGGAIDVMILNQAGSTGLSLHASEKFKDKRPRHMIIAQAEKNIDTHMQMLGRVHRTGQVVTPSYAQLVADVPAEKRPAAVLAKKMASLNANTTASRSGALTAEDVPDFMNEYGDEVAARIMADNPDIHKALGEPLKDKKGGDGYEADEAVRKVTGRIPLLPIEQQEDLYEMLESEYKALIQQKEAAGESALEAKTLELDARTTDKKQVVAPQGSGSPFADGVYVESADVKRIGRPHPTARVLEMVAEEVGIAAQDGAKPEDALAALAREGRKSSLTTMNEVMKEFGAYRREVLDDMENDKTRDSTNKRLQSAYARWSHIMELASLGQAVRLQTETGNLYGIVVKVKKTGKARNPVALGAWKVTVALADASRQLTLPMSQMFTVQSRPAELSSSDIVIERAAKIGDVPVILAFDQMQQEARENRTIVTGNLLAGFDHVSGKGSIINFTDAEGAIRQGILMPRDYDYGASQADRPVDLRSAAQVLAFVRQGFTARASDGNVSISAAGGIRIEVAAAKSRGGQYYLDRRVLDAAGRDFVKVADVMRVEVSEDRAARVIDALKQVGAGFQAKDHLDAARKIAGEVSQTAKLQRGLNEDLGPLPGEVRLARGLAAVPSETLTSNDQAVARAVGAVIEKMAPGVRQRGYIAMRATEESGNAGEVFGAQWSTREGEEIRHVIAWSFAAEDPAKTARHEVVHYLKRVRLLDDQEWSTLHRAAERREWVARHDIAARYPEISGDMEAMVEEAVAEEFAAWRADRFKDYPAGVRRIFLKLDLLARRVRAAVRSIVGKDATWEDLFTQIEAGAIGSRQPRDDAGRFTSPKFERPQPSAQAGTDGSGNRRPPSNVAFDSEESERRWQDARKGVGGAGSLRERVTAWLEHLGHGFTRHYIELPNISRYADVHEQLRKLEAAPQASKEQVVRFLRDITNGMSAADLDLFTRKVVLDDLAYEVTQEHALPFGLTPGTLEAELVKVDIALAARPDLEAKVRQRQLFTRKVANMLVEAGVLHKDSVKNPAYYRHQVLDYARAQVAYAKGAGKKVKTPHWASRHGSELDINANLLEAEFDWLHKALTDISTAKTISWIKRSEHNIRSSIVKQARDQNAALVQQALDKDLKDNGYTDEKGRDTSPMNEQWKAFKKSIAMGLDSVGKAVKSGKIGPIPAEFSAVAESLADKDAEGDGDKLFPFLSWLLDNDKPGAMGAAQAFKAIVGRKALVKGLLGEKYTDTTNMELVVKRFAPEGYTTWQPDEGKLLYTAKTLPEHVIDRLMRKLSAAGADAMATADVIAALNSVRPLLAVGGMKYQMVIPIELAATLNSLRDEQADSLLGHLTQKPLSMWKQWTLMSPRRWLTYNINNTSGDIDAVIAGNPSALKRAKVAAKELYAVMVKKEKPSARYLEAVERGVFDSGISLQEIPDINSLSEFQALVNPTNFKGPVDVTKFAMRKGWGFLRGSTTLRENVMRYALYLDYVERLEAGESMDKIGYGATKPAIVDAVKDVKDRAALLARDTIGDYGNVSHYGRWLRTNLMPFYSWMEVNTKRYWRLTGNAASQGIGKGVATGGALAVMAGTRTTGALALRMVALYGLVSLWNHLVFGDDEDDLSEAERIGLHINLGRDADGNIRTLRFNGAFSDFLGWIGFDDAARAFVNIESGRADWADVMKAAAKGAPNKVVLGVRPDLKLAVEGLAGVRFFPDIFNPRPLRDGWRNALQAVGLENEYDFALDRPSKGYVQSWFKGPLKTHDAGELAYSKIRGLAGDWMREQNGAEGVSTIETPRSNALHDYKLARKYGDVAAAKSARERLKELGVTGKELAASIKRAHPLGAVPLRDRGAFLRSLSAGERESLSRAVEWYRSTYLSPLSE